jgi:RNA polymerase sigma-70 factor (ECF subfamily)
LSSTFGSADIPVPDSGANQSAHGEHLDQLRQQDMPAEARATYAEPVHEDSCFALFLEKPTEDSFQKVCFALSPKLMRYFRMRGCDSAAAEEMTQDVLFTVFRQSAGIRDRTLFVGWVYKVAKNTLLQRWRKSRRTIDTLSLEATGSNLPEAAVGAAPLESDFTDLIAHLEPEEREIITMRFVLELDYREIAAALEIPVGTAKWRVVNCKMKVAMHLRKPQAGGKKQ